MKVLHYPFSESNPYQRLMFDGLRIHGVEPRHDPRAILHLFKSVAFGGNDILHLHWISGPMERSSLSVSFLWFVVFQASLFIWKLRGKRLVWTVHNLVNHEKRNIKLDRLNSKLVSRMADRLLVHGKGAKTIVSKEFKVEEKKISIIYHGNYEGVVSVDPIQRRTNEGTRFLFFGRIRSYKGVIDLVDAFRDIDGNHQLCIAGLPRDAEIERELIEKARKDGRITLKFEFLSDREVESLLNWCHIVVLPYKDVLTSGSLLMALTAGRPIVASREGVIPEYVDDACSFVYDASAPFGLRGALESAATCSNLPEKSEAALCRSKKYAWADIGKMLADVYSEIIVSAN